jgi:hypothetical protein
LMTRMLSPSPLPFFPLLLCRLLPFSPESRASLVSSSLLLRCPTSVCDVRTHGRPVPLFWWWCLALCRSSLPCC